MEFSLGKSASTRCDPRAGDSPALERRQQWASVPDAHSYVVCFTAAGLAFPWGDSVTSSFFFVPEGRLRVAQHFSAGFADLDAVPESRQGRLNQRFRRVQSSLTGLRTWFNADLPALKCWATLSRPYG